MSQELINACTTKEELLAYAEEKGIKVKATLGFSKMKALLIASVPSEKTLFEAMEKETSVQLADNLKPIAGGQTLNIIFGGKIEEAINLSHLEQWCEEHNLPFATVSSIVDKSWVNHNGYSFVMEK